MSKFINTFLSIVLSKVMHEKLSTNKPNIFGTSFKNAPLTFVFHKLLPTQVTAWSWTGFYIIIIFKYNMFTARNFSAVKIGMFMPRLRQVLPLATSDR